MHLCIKKNIAVSIWKCNQTYKYCCKGCQNYVQI